MRNILSLTLLSLLVACSDEDNSRKYKRSFYENGVLMSEGYYNRADQPIDTIKFYSNDRTLKELAVYNNHGELNGENVLFYPNGRIRQIKNYSNNILNGEFYNYYYSGKLKSIGIARDGYLQGDRYHYYENGQYKAYNFLDFNEHNAIVHFFDSLTHKRVQADGEQLIIDSIEYRGDSLHIVFLLSHPPFSKNRILLEKLGANNQIISQLVIPDTGSLFKIKMFKDSNLKSIILGISQLDSVAGINKEYNRKYDLNE